MISLEISTKITETKLVPPPFQMGINTFNTSVELLIKINFGAETRVQTLTAHIPLLMAKNSNLRSLKSKIFEIVCVFE